MASKYDPIKPEIIRLLSEGWTLYEVCKQDDYPSHGRVLSWVTPDGPDYDADFADKYARARQVGYLVIADQVISIADDGRNDWMERNDPDNPGYVANGEHQARSRLRLETRKWMLSKMLPKIYGDKLDVTSGGEKLGSDLSRLSIEELDALKAIRAKIDGSGD